MPECTICGEYTKFNGGLCYSCYKEENDESSSHDASSQKGNTQTKNENPWVSGVIKGRIAETIIEQLFFSLGFQVYKYGMENTIPGITELLKGVRGDVSTSIRQMPDFVVFKDQKAHFIEVKYRANGSLKLKDIEKYGPYPFENALIVLVTKKHIKCISVEELKSGKEIKEGDRFYLGNRKEFDTDSSLIIDYCKYAVKYFENV